MQAWSGTTNRWGVLASSCAINLCVGSVYAWSVFAGPAAARLGVDDLSFVFTIANSVGPITMISGGTINDRIGSRWVVRIGGILFGSGMLVSALAGSVAALVVGYGLGCGLGMGFVYGCTISNCVKLFPDRRGLAGGLTTAAYGLGSVFTPPAANAVIEQYGVSAAFCVFGVVFLAVICLCALFQDRAPELPGGIGGREAKGLELGWRQMLTCPRFYVLLSILFGGALFGLMVISHASPMAEEQIGASTAQAAILVSVLALFNTVGRVGAGYISDHVGQMRTIAAALFLGILGLALLIHAQGMVAFCIAICAVGVCFGTFMGVYPGLTASQFGARNSSVNYGIMFIGFALAGFVGPTLGNHMHSPSGGYQRALFTALLIAILSLALVFAFLFWQRKMNGKG